MAPNRLGAKKTKNVIICSQMTGAKLQVATYYAFHQRHCFVFVVW